jgi:opacity protein-like surface antigen
MKKLVTILAAALLLVSASAFAADSNETKATSKVEKSFQKDFAGADNISWNKSGGFYYAHFEMNSSSIEAAYNEDGVLVATSREIDAKNLPLPVTIAISNKYKGYDVAKKGQEITVDGQTDYYINVGNDQQVLKLKCTVNGDILIDKKTKLSK